MQQAKAASAAGLSASATTAMAQDTGTLTQAKGKHAQAKPKQGAAASTQAAASEKRLGKPVGKPGRPAGKAQQSSRKSAAATDAVTLLKNDHRTVEQLFKSYEEVQGTSTKSDLARQICMELIIHTHLEEQIFYPACRENGVEDDALDEAQVEHDGAKVMIADLLEGSPEDPYYLPKVKVLKEYIRHHVNEEEKADGIFAKARQASLDLDELGTQLKSMKDDLTAEGDAVAAAPLEVPSLQLNNIHAISEETQMPRQSSYDYDESYRSSRSRDGGNRMRDAEGRFMSDDDEDRGSRGRSRSARSSYDDDRGSHGGRGQGGWFRDSEDHVEAAQQGWRSRDDDDGRGRSRLSRSYEDDDYRSSRGRGGARMRDEEGRFISDDDDDRGNRSRSSRSGYEDDDGYRSSRGHGGWFGDPEGHSRAASQRQQSQSSDYDDDDDRGGRSRSRSRSQSSRNRSNEGHGGWFGDPRGHSQAARRGWRDRD